MRVSLDKINTVKTCKSCKHYRWPLWNAMWAWATDNRPRCGLTAPDVKIDVVSGKIIYPNLDDYESCSRQRENDYSSTCASEARNWIPKDKNGIFELIKHTEELSNN